MLCDSPSFTPIVEFSLVLVFFVGLLSLNLGATLYSRT